eukprot:gene8682-8863_t
MVAVGCHAGDVLLLVPGNQSVVAALALPETCLGAVTAVRFRPQVVASGGTGSNSSSLLLVAKGSHLIQVHPGSNSVVNVVNEQHNNINNVAVRQDSQFHATCGSDTVVRVYEESRKQPLLHLTAGDGKTCCGHSNSIFGLCWKPDDPQVLLSAGWDGTGQVWDLREGHSIRSFAGGSYVCGDALDAHGSTVLTGSWKDEHALQLWDFGSGRLLTNLPFFQSQPGACRVYGARFGPANSAMKRFIIAGGSGHKPCLRMYHQV